jgi:hypothetical protein
LDLRDIFSFFQHAKWLPKCQIADDVKCKIVIPVQAINLGELPLGIVGNGVPLSDEDLKVLVHVDLELADGFGGECMRDGLAFASVLSAIAGIEETALDGNEGIVKITEVL